MKTDRKKIHQMFGGRCCYCGEVLLTETGKYMHIEHLEPLERVVRGKGCHRPQNENKANLMPCCPKCNIKKSSLPLESFRTEIMQTIENLIKYNNQFKQAQRFGMIEIKIWDGVFWFEKYGK